MRSSLTGPSDHRSSLSLEVDVGLPDGEWDAWVESMPGGHHLQTTGWAHVKAAAGWRARRILLRADGVPMAGCQMLLRPLPIGRSAAYIPRGPLTATRASAPLDDLLAAVRQSCRQEGVVLLKIQPPVDRDDLGASLAGRGFSASGLQTAPSASARVDVQAAADEAELLQAMRPDTRRRVRQAQRHGIRVRAGTREDLPILQSLLKATGLRQGFEPYPMDYYIRLWDAFSVRGNLRLLISERAERPLSAALLIAFGDTVIYKVGAWGGDREAPGAPVLMHWEGIRWARRAGYRWYDFEGIRVRTTAGSFRW
jgi:lipid II:glycine glycyltransferase (peptidoglycan interpeptide bridge formation enzyme)